MTASLRCVRRVAGNVCLFRAAPLALRSVLTLVAACSVSGCYLSHPVELAGDASGDDAGSSRDAGSRPDGGLGGMESGTVSPPDGGGVGRWDGNVPPLDGGVPPFDGGGLPARDGGSVVPIDGGRRDGGSAGMDGGLPSLDGGPPLVDAGPARPALRLSTTTFFSVGDAPTFDIPGDSSFEAWVRSRELRDVDFCGKGNRLARDLIVGQRGGRIVAGWQAAGEDYLLEGPEVPFDQWVHVSIVRRADADGTHAARLFVNGELVASASSVPRLSLAFNEIDFRCGLAEVDVDEVRLWRVTRTADDVAATFQRRVSGGIPGLMHYWRLDERGQILTDYTPMGRVGINGRLTTPDPADGTWILDGAI
jgi:hypothetical protein